MMIWKMLFRPFIFGGNFVPFLLINLINLLLGRGFTLLHAENKTEQMSWHFLSRINKI